MLRRVEPVRQYKRMLKGVNKMFLKIHERSLKGITRTVVAACDEDVLGKVHKSGEVVLDLKTYRDFYEGEKVSEKQLQNVLQGAINVNLVGKKTIQAASVVLPLSLKDARKIGGIPHIQFYRV